MAIAFVAGTATALGAQAPLVRRSAEIPGLISKARLNPPMRSRVRELRFSPNGAYVLLQNETITYVISTNPLGIVLQLATYAALPLRFSADSKTIVSATPNMQVARYNVSDGKEVDNRTLGNGGRCYASGLSPDGESYACLDDQSELRIFRVRTGDQIFDGRVGEQLGQAAQPVFFPSPYHANLARSEPFGYYMAHTPSDPADFTATATMLKFSPDGRYLIARGLSRDSATVVDLQRGAQVDLPKPLRHAITEESVAFVAADQMAAADPIKTDDGALLSFPSGATVRKLDISGTLAGTNNPRYLLTFSGSGTARIASVIDVETGKTVANPSKLGADVWGSQIVSYTDDGVLAFTRIGDDKPFVRAGGLIPPLATMHAAAVSPSFATIAIGVLGQGTMFDVATGKRIASFDAMNGAWFTDERTCRIRVPSAQPESFTLENVDAGSGAVSDPISIENMPLRNEHTFSGPVLLSHYVMRPTVLMETQEMPFELHGLDEATGKTLWMRAFGGDISRINTQKNTPIPFTDPQGDRVVLGWQAKSAAGEEAAGHDATAKRLFKQAKISPHDSLFEVLDARSGKTVAAVLVQTGAGPDTFDSAFSEGDWLVLEKNGRSAMVYSLSTGEQVAQETGYGPAISAATGLLSVATDDGHLELYDLKARAQKYVYQFAGQIAYSHFSADGTRLLVLTEDQMVYSLDLAKLPATPVAPATQP